MPTMRWGTVISGAPLRVVLDGDIDPLPFAPQSTVQGLANGSRVLCVEQNRRVIVISSTTPTLPAPKKVRAAYTSTITAPAAAWQTIPAIPGEPNTLTFGELPRALEVQLLFNAIGVTSTGETYAMIGAACVGGLTLQPDYDQAGPQSFDYTPFSNIPGGSNPMFGTKHVIVPPGAATTFYLQSRRNVATGVQSVNYPALRAIPLRWV